MHKHIFKCDAFLCIFSELAQEIDVLQEIYIDELQIETSNRFCNFTVLGDVNIFCVTEVAGN